MCPRIRTRGSVRAREDKLVTSLGRDNFSKYKRLETIYPERHVSDSVSTYNTDCSGRRILSSSGCGQTRCARENPYQPQDVCSPSTADTAPPPTPLPASAADCVGKSCYDGGRQECWSVSGLGVWIGSFLWDPRVLVGNTSVKEALEGGWLTVGHVSVAQLKLRWTKPQAGGRISGGDIYPTTRHQHKQLVGYQVGISFSAFRYQPS
ncbi:unnamed protein product [Pylaiella littoralis]